MSILAKDKGIALKTEVADDIPLAVKGDSLRLRQILLNLLSNAIKFTNRGSVTLQLELTATRNDQKTLRFTLTDTGVGIKSEKLDVIFDMFIQADNSVTRMYGETGLGLSICKQICKLMGGDIEATSEPGHGSVFSVTIPFRHAEPTELLTKKNIDGLSSTLPPLHILLVEDNEFNQDLARIILEQNNHKVVIADNGLEALKILGNDTFDIILMDVQMPQMDGLTATSIIRACEKGENVIQDLPAGLIDKLKAKLGGGYLPIIALTAHAMATDCKQCLEAGMDDYQSKPFNDKELYRTIGGLLHGKILR